MIRTLAAMSALVLVAASSHATQDRPAPKKADVIKELHRDFDAARAGLQKDDPGAKTRAAHRRIIDGLEELLKQEEDKSSISPQAAPPQQPKESAQPMPKVQPLTEPQSIPERTPAPQRKFPERPEVSDGPWNTSRPWQQEAVDAPGRERFPRRYEELLRAYYRSLAAGRGDEQ